MTLKAVCAIAVMAKAPRPGHVKTRLRTALSADETARAGLRILELPAPCRRRAAGVSKVAGSPGGTLRASTKIVSTFARVALHAGPR